MPEKILALLEKYSLTKEQIASKLGVTPEELDAVMEYLQQMGFIRATAINPASGGCRSCSGGCGGNCSECGITCSAASNSGYTVWELI